MHQAWYDDNIWFWEGEKLREGIYKSFYRTQSENSVVCLRKTLLTWPHLKAASYVQKNTQPLWVPMLPEQKGSTYVLIKVWKCVWVKKTFDYEFSTIVPTSSTVSGYVHIRLFSAISSLPTSKHFFVTFSDFYMSSTCLWFGLHCNFGNLCKPGWPCLTAV